MEVEEVTKPGSEDQVEVPSLGQSQDTIERLIEESKSESQTNGTEAASAGKSAKSPVEQEEKTRKEPEKESPSQDGPSKRVREGQKWNDRPRKQYGNPNDRPHKRHNNKSDLVSQQESSDPVAIRKQVEFYFSDSNLLTDKFLFTKVEGHENLPVPISTIHSFKRMRHFQPLSAIVDALKESTILNVVEDDTSIQRKTPLPEGLVGKPMVEIQKVHEDKTMARSVYAKGFGEERPSTQFDIEAYFAQHGPTNSVRLRRSYDGTFKGSVFVEFDSEETQNAFLALDPKPKWQSNELQVKSKKQYCDDKVDDIAAGRVRPNEDDRAHQNGNRDWAGRDHDRRGEKGVRRDRDDKDDRDWRVRREEDRKGGFKDRNGGKHKGFRGSERGRGGGRGREGRDRSRNRNDQRRERDERGVPKVRTSSPGSDDKDSPSTEKPVKDEAKEATDTLTKNDGKAVDATTAPPEAPPDAAADPGSKKRAREDDDGAEEQGNSKKVDSKVEES
ncbi:hypothetical protein HO173_002672 [Letharia columbiana]|uniref:Uncharacterized protein n=1 Tax=Letharia columbiana TaxID=112416 RepID=A0A8H6L8G8_9LECA|nr:uncharacterized protein HO173_002672 [Letharia columbiana]KAF6239410.1 hypothetical protein HO173_002672 [Letharia columbiana]